VAERQEKLTYQSFPTLAGWQRDSSVRLATRAKDQLLTRIDEIVDAVNQANDDGARIYLECDLFFTLDQWLKVYQQTSTMEKGRAPAVTNLYKFVAYALADAFNCSINVLPRELEFYFGRELSAHGQKLDAAFDCAAYLQRAELRKYKLYFKNGLAHQFPWWKKGKKFDASKFLLANSSYASNNAVFDPHNVGYRSGWGGFAMSMGREIYMARHHCTKARGANGNFYHSSYLGGQRVMLAGTMLITNGVVKAVSTDSGHYQPDQRHVVNFLQALQMYGVSISNIDIQDYNGTFVAKGNTFLANNGNWAAMVARRRANLTHITRNLAENSEFEDRIRKLWEQGVASGTFADNMDGRVWFCGTLLPYYVNSAGETPFAAINFEHALNALNRATHRAPDATQKWWFDNWTTYLRQNKGVTDTDATRVKFAQAWAPKTGWTVWQIRTTLDKAYRARNLPLN
jgi:hypothetical protein